MNGVKNKNKYNKNAVSSEGVEASETQISVYWKEESPVNPSVNLLHRQIWQIRTSVNGLRWKIFLNVSENTSYAYIG